MSEPPAVLRYDESEVDLPIVRGSEDEPAIDISKLRSQTGFVTLDYGFVNTGSCESAITYIDGDAGILRYRGIPIEQLVEREHPSFLETCYLLIWGDLATQEQLDEFRYEVRRHTLIKEDVKRFYDGFPKDAHPMAILSSVVERAVHLLPGQRRHPRRGASAPVDRAPHRQAPDDRLVRLQEVHRAAVPLSQQRARPHRELPHDDVRGAFGTVRGQPDRCPHAEAAAHPARRSRAELLDVDGAARRIERSQPLGLGGRRHQRPVGTAPRRRQPGSHRDAGADPGRRR